MRINVYNEELTSEVTLFRAKSKNQFEFTGVRFFLESSNELHHTSEDDDRSAVTFFFDDNDEAIEFFKNVYKNLLNQKEKQCLQQ